jgi:hypothetical protein
VSRSDWNAAEAVPRRCVGRWPRSIRGDSTGALSGCWSARRHGTADGSGRFRIRAVRRPCRAGADALSMCSAEIRAITGHVEFENHCVVHEPIDRGRCRHRASRRFCPVEAWRRGAPGQFAAGAAVETVSVISPQQGVKIASRLV